MAICIPGWENKKKKKDHVIFTNYCIDEGEKVKLLGAVLIKIPQN